MSNGMTPDDARREAERRFGDVEHTRERLATIDRAFAGQERRTEWWNAFRQDVRYAIRGFRLKPGFALAVIVTLALGIGANATMFGVVDRLLFRPPSYLDAPARVGRVYITRFRRGTNTPSSFIGYQRYTDLRDWTSSFDAMTPFAWNYLAVGGTVTREMRVGLAGSDLWKMFGVKPVIGRFYTAAEDTPPTGVNVVVLSYAFWQTQFGGRLDALGAKLEIGDGTYTVIGVAPDGFSGFADTPLVAFIPMTAASVRMGSPEAPWYQRYTSSWFELFARRKPGVSAETATADLTAAYQRSYRAQIERAPTNTPPFDVAKPAAFAGPLLFDRGPGQRSDAKVSTWLAGVASIVLLVACANVANLLLGRALRRRREIAVRLALGISRSRLVMQLITESMLLALAGGALGLVIAQWGGAVVRATLLGNSGDAATLADPRVVLFAAVLTIATGLVTGLAPVLQARRADVATALKSGTREGAAHRSRLRSGLLASQAALSVVLLVGA
ncbi:MAG: ABC transporter permease, partial [bacterium]